MSLNDILDSVQYVVDNDGKQTAVQLNLPAWETLRVLLEDAIEDGRLGNLMKEVTDDERLEGDAALKVYQDYVAQA